MGKVGKRGSNEALGQRKTAGTDIRCKKKGVRVEEKRKERGERCKRDKKTEEAKSQKDKVAA